LIAPTALLNETPPAMRTGFDPRSLSAKAADGHKSDNYDHINPVGNAHEKEDAAGDHARDSQWFAAVGIWILLYIVKAHVSGDQGSDPGYRGYVTAKRKYSQNQRNDRKRLIE
jgi:hypothetical protein